MNRDLLATTSTIVGCLTFVSLSIGDEVPPSRLAIVAPGPFAVTLDLEGVFVDPDATVVAYRPEVSKHPVEVVAAAAPGPVSRGQVLVRLRSDGLDEEIRRAEIELALSHTRLLVLREESRRAEEAMQLRLVQANLAVDDAERALDAKITIDAPQRLENSEDRVRDWDVQRREQEEMFRILVQMYEADEILETTEQMDIEVQKRWLDRGLERRAHLIARHEILKHITLPREVEALELAVRKAKHARDVLQGTSPMEIEQARHDLTKRELAFRGEQRTLKKLCRDRDALTIKSPVDGFAIAGHYTNRWKELDETARRLRPNTRVLPDQVLYTVVRPAPRVVRTSIPEVMLFEIPEGHEATIVPTAAATVLLPATVALISRFSADGQFDMWLEARTRHERLFPGGTCRVRMTLEKPDALTVPAAAVRREGGITLIEVWKDGEATPRSVTVGATSGDRTEILAGVMAGERVVLAGSVSETRGTTTDQGR